MFILCTIHRVNITTKDIQSHRPTNVCTTDTDTDTWLLGCNYTDLNNHAIGISQVFEVISVLKNCDYMNLSTAKITDQWVIFLYKFLW
jgi:hypothetical protein